jgi:hypothetical protein
MKRKDIERQCKKPGIETGRSNIPKFEELGECGMPSPYNSEDVSKVG